MARRGAGGPGPPSRGRALQPTESESESTEAVGDHVRRRALSGVRWSIALNLVTVPLSFLTNMLLGRTSADALGYYGAIQIFTGAIQALLVPGGRDAFARFVPGLPRNQRFAFLCSYLTAVLPWLLLCIAAVFAVPAVGAWVQAYFRMPDMWIAAGAAVAMFLFGFATHFLYGILEAPRAVVTLRSVVVGFFLLALTGAWWFAGVLRTDPATYLWRGTLVIYAGAALLGLAQVLRTSEARGETRWKWTLPRGFWATVGYAHAGTIVNFTYTSLVPAFVLLWLDVSALARLHAATRYVLLFGTIPVLTGPVLAPGIAKLDASGMRDHGIRQASAAVRASLLFIYPACVAAILFAGDAMAVFNPEFRSHRDVLRIVVLMSLAAPTVHYGASLAAGLGAFRRYLLASLVFVVTSICATAILVPAFGLTGAAVAMAFGAFVQQMAISAVLWTLGFRLQPRVLAAWSCGLAAMAVSLVWDPDRLAAAALLVVLLALFTLAGRVTPSEIAGLGRRLLRRG